MSFGGPESLLACPPIREGHRERLTPLRPSSTSFESTSEVPLAVREFTLISPLAEVPTAESEGPGATNGYPHNASRKSRAKSALDCGAGGPIRSERLRVSMDRTSFAHSHLRCNTPRLSNEGAKLLAGETSSCKHVRTASVRSDGEETRKTNSSHEEHRPASQKQAMPAKLRRRDTSGLSFLSRGTEGLASLIHSPFNLSRNRPFLQVQLSKHRKQVVDRSMSSGMVAAFGCRGVLVIACAMGAVLLAGTVLVWYYKGLQTRELVYCLSQVLQVEVASQVSHKLVEVFQQARTIVHVAHSAGALLTADTTATAGGDEALLAMLADVVRAAAPAANHSLTTFLSGFIGVYHGYALHLGSVGGDYLGLAHVASPVVGKPQGLAGTALEDSDSLRLLRSADGGLSLQLEYLANLTSSGYEVSEAAAITDWRVSEREWHSREYNGVAGLTSGVPTCTVASPCISRAYATNGGAAIALYAPLRSAAGSVAGYVAVEVALSAVETRLRQLLSTAAPDGGMFAALVDDAGAMLAVSRLSDEEEHPEVFEVAYAQPPPLTARLWVGASRALGNMSVEGYTSSCVLASIDPKKHKTSNDYCDRLEMLAPANCTQRGPITLDEAHCALLSECPIEASYVSGVIDGGVPEGWKIQLIAPEKNYYPGFTNALVATLTFSLLIAFGATVSLAHLLWQYNKAGRSFQMQLPLCCAALPGLRSKAAVTSVLIIVLFNYSFIFGVWYYLFKKATHALRERIVVLMQNEVAFRMGSLLAFPLRGTSITSAWSTLYGASASAYNRTAVSFAILGAELLAALQPQSPLGRIPLHASPPSSRLTVRSPLAQLLYVPPGSGAVDGVRLVPSSSSSLLRTNCSVALDLCRKESFDSPWWVDAAMPSSRWSEVHLFGEEQQLAVTYVAPLHDGGWVTGTLPLSALTLALPRPAYSIMSQAFVMQKGGEHPGALITASGGGAMEERREQVGGSWFTARRSSSFSPDEQVRFAAKAVEFTVNHHTYFGAAGFSVSTDTFVPELTPAPTDVPTISKLSELFTAESSEIHRVQGLPRTSLTPLLGCKSSDGCGLSWRVISLVNFAKFFEFGDRDRDFSFQLFLLWLLLQLYVLHTTMRTTFRRIDSQESRKVSHEGWQGPSNAQALAELGGERRSATKSLDGSEMPNTPCCRESNEAVPRLAKWYTYIENEVKGALAVTWYRTSVRKIYRRVVLFILLRLPKGCAPRLRDKLLLLQKPLAEDECRYRRACKFMDYSQQHRNILTVCALRQLRSFRLLTLYIFVTSRSYQLFYQSVIMLHCILQVREPSPGQLEVGRLSCECPISLLDWSNTTFGVTSGAASWNSEEPRNWLNTVMLIELGCLLVETFNMGANFVITSAERRRKRNGIRIGLRDRIAAMFTGVNMLQSHTEATLQVVRMAILACLYINWIFLNVTCRSFENVVPLRPLLLLLSNSHLRSVCVCIGKTLRSRGTRSVAFCFLLLWFLASNYATLVLSSQGTSRRQAMQGCAKSTPPGPSVGGPPAPPPALPSPVDEFTEGSLVNEYSFTSSSFSALIPSLLSMFVLITTGENYVDLVSRPWFCFDPQIEGSIMTWPAVLTNIFFVCLFVLGSVLMVGMFIGIFQIGFAEERVDQMHNRKLFERVGAIAAFSLLVPAVRTNSTQQTVSVNEFGKFIQYLERTGRSCFNLSQHEILQLVREEISTDSNEDGLTLEDFVFNLWRLQLKGVLYHRRDDAGANAPKWRRALRAAYKHRSQVLQKIVKSALLLHALLASPYALMSESARMYLDGLLFMFVCFELAEVGLKLLAQGFKRFWDCAEFDDARVFEQWENRTAFVVSVITGLSYCAARANSNSTGYITFEPNENFHRLTLVLPTLRLLFVIKSARRVMFALVPLRAYIAAALGLMALVTFAMATIGVYMFESTLDWVADDISQKRADSFNSVGGAILSLVQISVGESWHEVMYTIMNGKHSFYWSVYFMAYVLLQTLMLTNLLVGVVLDSCDWFDMNEGGEEITMQRRILFGDQIMELDELEGMYHRRKTRADTGSSESPMLLGHDYGSRMNSPREDSMNRSRRATHHDEQGVKGRPGRNASAHNGQSHGWREFEKTLENRRTEQEESVFREREISIRFSAHPTKLRDDKDRRTTPDEGAPGTRRFENDRSRRTDGLRPSTDMIAPPRSARGKSGSGHSRRPQLLPPLSRRFQMDQIDGHQPQVNKMSIKSAHI